MTFKRFAWSAWRRRFAGPDDRARVIGFDDFWKRDIKAPALPVRIPFLEAVAGRMIPVTGPEPKLAWDWATPIIARSDLARWVGADEIPSDPPERPANWPDKSKRNDQLARSEAVRLFVTGYAAAVIHATSKPVGKRDDHMEQACKAAVPGCTQAEVWRAYSSLQRDLRNPTPAEKGAATKRG